MALNTFSFVEGLFNLFGVLCGFFTIGAMYFFLLTWWDSKFDNYYVTDERGEDTGDYFINAAMFQDME